MAVLGLVNMNREERVKQMAIPIKVMPKTIGIIKISSAIPDSLESRIKQNDIERKAGYAFMRNCAY